MRRRVLLAGERRVVVWTMRILRVGLSWCGIGEVDCVGGGVGMVCGVGGFGWT